MKNFKAMSVSALIGIFFFTACQKEEINENKSLAATSTVNDGELIAQNYMKKSYAKYAEVSTEEFIRQADPIKQSLIQNKRIAYDKSTEEMPLGDLFFIHEGVINSIHAVPLNSFSIVDVYETTVELPVFEEDGDYYIEIEDYNAFYGDIVNTIAVELTSEQALSIADFELNSVSAGMATIGVQFYIGQPIQLPSAPLPDGEVHGAELAGWCGLNNPGIDAAVFVDGYMNSSHGWASYNCPTGQNPYFVSMAWFDTFSNASAQDLPFDIHAVQGKFWTDDVNSCVGDNSSQMANNAIWNNLYNDAVDVNTILLPNVRSYMNNQNMELIATDIHSHNNGPVRDLLNRPVTDQYYHGGRYVYGLIYCN